MTNKKSYKSFSGHGVDVAVNRADDLDKLCLDDLGRKKNARVLDLGCGAGGQSLRMVQAGAEVVAIDKHDFSAEFDCMRDEIKVGTNKLKFICADLLDLGTILKTEKFTNVCLQRTLHYLRYAEAVELLKFLHQITEDKLYISVTGISSGIGDKYQGKEVSIKERFFELNNEEADKYSIHESVCLYTEEEFLNLLGTTGWKIDWYRRSDFGNLKADCERMC